MYADVLVEYSAKMVDQTFTYIIPLALASKLKRGMKVLVPFGSKVINGFVVNISDNKSYDNLKEIISITDENFCLNDELLSLGKYLKNYCFCSLISIYQAMLPASMKVKSVKSNYDKYDEYLVLGNGYNDYILNDYTFKVRTNSALYKLIDKYTFIIRKTAHFSIYLILGILSINLLSSFDIKCIIAFSGLICFIYACTDEFHQLFIMGRSCEMRDVLIDTLGSFVGILIYYKTKLYINKRQKLT